MDTFNIGTYILHIIHGIINTYDYLIEYKSGAFFLFYFFEN